MKKHELEAAIKAAQAAQLAGGGGGMSSNESTTILPDGSAFAIWSLPLPEDHWLTAPYAEWDDVRDTSADTPTPILTHALREHVIAAARYAIRGATANGTDMDFDPDAMVLNFCYALCGPFGVAKMPENTTGDDGMKTIDDALKHADTFDSPHSKHMSLVMLAAEVRRLRDEVNGLTGSADQASAWQEAIEDIASYMSVGVEGCDPVEAAARIKKASDDFVRVAVQRAERAEAAIAPMVETAQNQQEEIHRLWVTFSKAAEILGLDPQKEWRIPRPPSDTFTQAISRLVAERDVALAALKEAAQQKPVAYVKYKATGGNVGLSWVAIPTGAFYPREGEQLYAAPIPAVAVPAEWREVLTELADDLSIELDMRYQSRSHYPSELRKYENEMQLVYRARALLQSTGDKK